MGHDGILMATLEEAGDWVSWLAGTVEAVISAEKWPEVWKKAEVLPV